MKVTVNDTELYFDIEGASLVPDGSGMKERPTVVLLHGGPGFDHAYFKPFVSELADTAQLVYLDQRGQGRSGRPPLDTCTIEQMADDLVVFCHTLGIERPIILGHSFGGFVALQLAVRHPGVASGLVLVDTGAASEDMGDAMATIEQRYGAEARDAAIQVFTGNVTPETGEAFQRLVLPAYVSDTSKIGTLAWALGRTIMNTELIAYYFSRDAAAYDLRPYLSKIGEPTLVVVGDHDWLLPPAAGRTIADGIPGAELLIMQNCGHMPFIEQPGAFSAAVRQFLASSLKRADDLVGVGGI